MKGFLKNIIRLPNVFLTVFLVVLLSTVLILLCNSVYTSCGDAMEKLNRTTEIPMEITLKQRLERVETEDGGYEIVDLNTKLLDGQVLEILRAEERLSDIRYIGNTYYFSAGLLCTEEEYLALENAMAENGSFVLGRQLGFSEVGVAGCTHEELLHEVLGVGKEDLSVTYLPGASPEDGVLLPKALYDGLGQPDLFFVGWYKTESYGLQPDAEIPGYLLTHFEELKKKPDPPMLPVPVCGYYTCKDGTKAAAVMVAGGDYWQSIYKAQDYYALRDNQQTFVRPDADAFGEAGLSKIEMTTAFPGEVADIISGLMEKGVDGDSYFITASDYEYKFVLVQMESMGNFSGVILYAAILFGILILAVFLAYALRKRQKEIYILRALGREERYIAFSFTLELGAVMLTALLCGVLAAYLWGNGICGMISKQALENANASAESLSLVAQNMANSEILREQMENAARKYAEADFSLTYEASLAVYKWLLAAVAVFSGYAYTLTRRITKRNMMYKEG